MAPSLPSHPSLERFRRDARRLLRSLRAGDPDAVRLFRRHHPDPGHTDSVLADAQLVLARSCGFASWPKLRHYLDVARPLTRTTAAPADASEEDVCALACLTYSSRDDPSRWTTAAELARTVPQLADRDIWTAAALADPAALARHLAAEPGLACAEGGPYRWVPLMYLTYGRTGLGDAVTAARLVVAHRADVDAGYLFAGLPTPFTALTGCFGEGEQGPGRQPRHPRSIELATVLLEHGAEPNDGQTLYNRMFSTDDSHLELLFAYGLGTGDGGVWRRRLGDALDSVPDLMAYQVRWARDHGMTKRLALLAAHGFHAEPVVAGPSVFRADSAAAVAAQVAAGADVDERRDGRTTLHHFAWIGDAELVRALLAAGADPAVTDDEHGTTPYDWAVYGHQPVTADLLQEGVAGLAVHGGRS